MNFAKCAKLTSCPLGRIIEGGATWLVHGNRPLRGPVVHLVDFDFFVEYLCRDAIFIGISDVGQPRWVRIHAQAIG